MRTMTKRMKCNTYCHVNENEDDDKEDETGRVVLQADHPVANGGEENGRDDAKRDEIAQQFGEKIG